jgi:hypothetical protein
MPEILLNQSFDGLEPLLRDAKDRSPVEQALHDGTRMAIARSVWMALISDAMAGVQLAENGGNPSWLEREWQTEVLKRIFPDVHPTASESEINRLGGDPPGAFARRHRSDVTVQGFRPYICRGSAERGAKYREM